MADQVIPSLDPGQGVSLDKSIVLYGGLPNPRRHYALQLLVRTDPGRAVERPWIGEFFERQVDGLCRVIDKLRTGELRATGLIRGAPPNQGPVEIHADLWRLLTVPGSVGSSAEGPGGMILDGILVFEGPVEKSGYGAKTIQLKKYIAAHRQELQAIPSLKKRAKTLAEKFRCSETLAKNALRDESLGG